jgi:preprotein translocase subunit SecE
MSAKLESQTAVAAPSKALDTVKLVVALVVIVAGIWLFYHFDQWPSYGRYLLVLTTTIVGGAIAYLTTYGPMLRSFARESNIELRKIVWPTRQETVQTTIAVLVLVIIVGIFLAGVDALFAWLTKISVG